jgi:hypothetical protein
LELSVVLELLVALEWSAVAELPAAFELALLRTRSVGAWVEELSV